MKADGWILTGKFQLGNKPVTIERKGRRYFAKQCRGVVYMYICRLRLLWNLRCHYTRITKDVTQFPTRKDFAFAWKVFTVWL